MVTMALRIMGVGALIMAVCTPGWDFQNEIALVLFTVPVALGGTENSLMSTFSGWLVAKSTQRAILLGNCAVPSGP
jgi:hypothetical protein